MPEKGSNALDSILTVDEYIMKKINGDYDEEIASELFVSAHTLERWKTKVGVKRYHVNAKRCAIINSMINDGSDMIKISRKLKLTDRQCYNILKQHS